MPLHGKTALVTGASRGIGRAVAIRLASDGANVAINFAGNLEKAQEVKAIIEANGGNAMLVQCDVSDFNAVEQMIKQITDNWKSIDILINNAGITRDALLLRMKPDDFDAVINTNLKGVFNCTKLVSKAMIKQRNGRIVNMSSVVALEGNAGQTNYAAAKAGIIGFTKSAARELAPRGITVNAVAPGFIETDMTNAIPDEIKHSTADKIPVGRLGRTEDIANAVAFLVSDQADYITGQVLAVDGGLAM
ncbi:MAG: 3-oxoacyl-[Selenomonadaceae bacterium]|nr:3-oxoacyl-[acyl-carrier-protein] reductase [Selenomonadaceae bacterium]